MNTSFTVFDYLYPSGNHKAGGRKLGPIGIERIRGVPCHDRYATECNEVRLFRVHGERTKSFVLSQFTPELR